MGEARILTGRIRDAAGSLWLLLTEAHDRQAWRALGYDTFRAYVETELQLSKQHAFRLLDQGRVIGAITDAAGIEESPAGDSVVAVTEREARDLKPHLPRVLDAVRAATADVEVEDRPAVAQAAVQAERRNITKAKATPVAAAPQKPRRGSLLDSASNSGSRARKGVESLERNFADDRFRANRTQMAARTRGDLVYIAEAVAAMLVALDPEVDR